LVEQGADINIANSVGYTSLFNACYNGNETLIKYLVELGADINKTNNVDDTPLFNACYNGNEAIVNI
jgi:ankyrin repeat protein